MEMRRRGSPYRPRPRRGKHRKDGTRVPFVELKKWGRREGDTRPPGCPVMDGSPRAWRPSNDRAAGAACGRREAWLGSGAGDASQRTGSRPSSASSRRISPGSACDWLSCAAAALFWMARAVPVRAPRSITQASPAPRSEHAKTGTLACPAAVHAARATARSSRSPMRGSRRSSRSAECQRIARSTRSASSATG